MRLLLSLAAECLILSILPSDCQFSKPYWTLYLCPQLIQELFEEKLLCVLKLSLWKTSQILQSHLERKLVQHKLRKSMETGKPPISSPTDVLKISYLET